MEIADPVSKEPYGIQLSPFARIVAAEDRKVDRDCRHRADVCRRAEIACEPGGVPSKVDIVLVRSLSGMVREGASRRESPELSVSLDKLLDPLTGRFRELTEGDAAHDLMAIVSLSTRL
jgi:hypothetical protein